MTLSNTVKKAILSHLAANHPWKDSIHWFDSIDSTNDHAKRLAAAGAPHGTVLIADSQTGGRGRRGRTFQSPGGCGVYLSVLLRPDCAPEMLMHLTCAAAEAMCDAVEAAAGFRPGIKWTNDLIFGGKKLGGILTELSVEEQSVRYAVIGIGINCCQEEQDFAPEIRDMAASLSMAAGKPVDRTALAAAMINALWKMDAVLLSEKASLMASYKADCITLGQDVVLLRGDEKRYGKALDVDEDGGLVVTFENGICETVTSGEISVRGMYGYV